MAIVVQKYGGSSVADVQKLRHVAERVVRTTKAGHDVVVVVSAMGDTTDDLLGMAKQVSAEPRSPRARHAADRGRAHLDGAAVDRHPRIGWRRHQLYRQPVRHHHQRSPCRRAHHRSAAVSRPGRARARQDRRRRGLPGRVVPPRGDDARPRRQRYDRCRDGGCARCGVLRNLLGRRWRLLRRSARRTGGHGASARSRTRKRRRWPSRARRS